MLIIKEPVLLICVKRLEVSDDYLHISKARLVKFELQIDKYRKEENMKRFPLELTRIPTKQNTTANLSGQVRFHTAARSILLLGAPAPGTKVSSESELSIVLHCVLSQRIGQYRTLYCDSCHMSSAEL